MENQVKWQRNINITNFPPAWVPQAGGKGRGESYTLFQTLPAYLSLVTDAASRVIVGWQLHPTLSKDGPIEALKKAIDFYRANHVNPAGLIHHSDRGTQYCCNEYIALLNDFGIRASMTQTGDPLHNALAERINNTVKNGWLFETQEKSFEEVKELVQKAVDIYNRVHPHQSLEMRTPLEEMKRLLEQAA